MLPVEMRDALMEAPARVLETMFFAEAKVAPEKVPAESALTCMVECSGGAEGGFVVSLDRDALRVLTGAFYGDDAVCEVQMQGVMAELTNMLAGCTLSRCLPERSCRLTSPTVSEQSWSVLGEGCAERMQFVVEGGVLAMGCWLKAEA